MSVHKHIGGSAGGPGECSAECACGTTFDGFDTHAEAVALLEQHIADEAARPVSPHEKLAAEQVAGLRALADFIEANPEQALSMRVPLKYLGSHIAADPKTAFASFAAAGARAGLAVDKEYSTDYAKVAVTFSPAVVVTHQADRAEVCERVVVGTETVTKLVPDPAKLAAVPEVEVSEEVEIVEWQCLPLLAAGGQS